MRPILQSLARDARGNSAGSPHQHACAGRRVGLPGRSGGLRYRARPSFAGVHHWSGHTRVARRIRTTEHARSPRVGGDRLVCLDRAASSVVACAGACIFLIGRRLRLPLPYAIAAVILLFLTPQYFHGAFTHDSFLAQAVATFFAVSAWWALIVWDEERSTISVILFAIFLVATFLTWPVFVGPLVLVFLALAAKTWRPLVIGIGPLAVFAAIHMAGRVGWLTMVRTSGAVLRPGFDSVGWLLPVLTLIGLVVSANDRRARLTIVFLLLIGLQAISLFAIATANGADTPYMAFKMVYLAIYRRPCWRHLL